MVRIKVQYDGYNRTFKLVDREFASELIDGATYELEVPLDIEEDIPGAEEFLVIGAPLAHA